MTALKVNGPVMGSARCWWCLLALAGAAVLTTLGAREQRGMQALAASGCYTQAVVERVDWYGPDGARYGYRARVAFLTEQATVVHATLPIPATVGEQWNRLPGQVRVPLRYAAAAPEVVSLADAGNDTERYFLAAAGLALMGLLGCLIRSGSATYAGTGYLQRMRRRRVEPCP